MAVLGLRFCVRAFSSCVKWGPFFIAVRGPLTIAASLVAEHRLQTRRLSNCGSRAQSLRGMWDPPRPGLEPVSPALAGRLSTTVPPGKPYIVIFNSYIESCNLPNQHPIAGYWSCFQFLDNAAISILARISCNKSFECFSFLKIFEINHFTTHFYTYGNLFCCTFLSSLRCTCAVILENDGYQNNSMLLHHEVMAAL